MASLAVLGVRIDSSKALAGLHALDNKLNKVGLSSTTVGAKLTKFGKIAGLAIGSLGIMSIKTAADFEQSMNKVSAIGGSTGKTLLALENQARDLGKSTVFSASEAADGMTFLAMAGFDAQQTMSAMPGVLNLAAASSTDLATSADIASNILSGLGLKASKTGTLVDVMAKATASANMNVVELGEAMKMSSPMAKTAGLSMQGMTAVIGKMADAGIKGGMAGTNLRAGIVKLLKPTTESKDALYDLGVSITNTDGTMRNFIDILADLEQGGASAADMVDIFGQRAGPSLMAAMSQGVGAIKELRTELDNSGGAAKKMADVQLQGLNGALKKLNSAWEELQIKFAKTGVLSAVTRKIEELTDALGKPETIERIKAFGRGVLEIGSAIKTVFDAVNSMPPFMKEVGVVMFFLGGKKAKLIVAALAGISWSIGKIGEAISAVGDVAEKSEQQVVKAFNVFERFKGLGSIKPMTQPDDADTDTQIKVSDGQREQLTWLDKMKNSWGGVSNGIKEYIKFGSDAENKTKALSDVGMKFATSMEDAFVKMAMGGKVSFKDMARSIIADLIRIQIRQAMVGAFNFGSGGGLSSLFKADGGSVTGNKPYIVGEEGPELFLPGKTGAIIPNGTVAKESASNSTNNVNVSFNITANDTQGFDNLLDSRRGMIVGIINQAMNDRGITGVTA
jgi:TP901 family phage tail tape measure protein